MGGLENTSQKTIAVASTAVIAALIVYRQHCSNPNQPSSIDQEAALPNRWYSCKDNRSNEAIQFRIKTVNRIELGIEGGLKALQFEDKQDSSIKIDDLIRRKNTVLYCVDFKERVFIFLDITSQEELNEEPFIDRGVRKLAVIGGSAFVVDFKSMENYTKPGGELDQQGHIESSYESICWVWNTGRCGSTLMHKALKNAGRKSCPTDASELELVSLTEPYWFDQFALYAEPTKQQGYCSIDESSLASLFRICHVLEFASIRAQNPNVNMFVMNPKAFGIRALNLAQLAFPDKQLSKHMFMYRDATKVIESFSSIFNRDESNWSRCSRFVRNMLPYFRIRVSSQQCKFKSTTMASSKFNRTMYGSHPMIIRMCFSWMDQVCLWIEYNSSQKQNIQNNEQSTLTIRMNEFVDPKKREYILNQVWMKATNGRSELSGLKLEAAVKAFGEHSQKGTTMAKSSANAPTNTKKFLFPSDIASIQETVLSCDILAQLGGANIVLPESLGVEK